VRPLPVLSSVWVFVSRRCLSVESRQSRRQGRPESWWVTAFCVTASHGAGWSRPRQQALQDKTGRRYESYCSCHGPALIWGRAPAACHMCVSTGMAHVCHLFTPAIWLSSPLMCPTMFASPTLLHCPCHGLRWNYHGFCVAEQRLPCLFPKGGLFGGHFPRGRVGSLAVYDTVVGIAAQATTFPAQHFHPFAQGMNSGSS
jgi:hypothetical protein